MTTFVITLVYPLANSRLIWDDFVSKSKYPILWVLQLVAALSFMDAKLTKLSFFRCTQVCVFRAHSLWLKYRTRALAMATWRCFCREDPASHYSQQFPVYSVIENPCRCPDSFKLIAPRKPTSIQTHRDTGTPSCAAVFVWKFSEIS